MSFEKMQQWKFLFKGKLRNQNNQRVSCKKSWIPLSKDYVVRDQSLKKFRRVSTFFTCITKRNKRGKMLQVIRMLVVIVLVFAICWTPHLTFLMLQGFAVIPVQLDGWMKFAKTAFILMAYMNRYKNKFRSKMDQNEPVL